MGRIIMYTAPGCRHCQNLKALLKENEVEYCEINIGDHMELRKEMIEMSGGKKTVPQLFFNDQHIGGFAEVETLIEEGEFSGRAKAALAAPNTDKPSVPQDNTGKAEETMTTSLDDQGRPQHMLNLLSLTQEMRDNPDKSHRLKIISRSFKLRRVHKTFKGFDLVDWLVKYKSCKKAEAIALAEEMMKEKLFYGVTSRKPHFMANKTLYRFYGDRDKRALNMHILFQGDPRPAGVVSANLLSSMLSMSDRFISDDGRGIDYDAIGKSSEFLQYIIHTWEMQKVNDEDSKDRIAEVDLSDLAPLERKAFFINIYNALVIHANIAIGPPTNLFSRASFFNKIGYVIGGQKYSLNQIEHGILRANRKPPGALRPSIDKSDARLKFSVRAEDFDPRIHFALVCGAKSCPPVRVYEPGIVDDALQMATEGFVSEEVIVDHHKRKIRLSMLFKWYRDDFGKNDVQVLEFILPFTSGPQRQDIESIVHDMRISKSPYKISYLTYNWDQNNRGYDEHGGAALMEEEAESAASYQHSGTQFTGQESSIATSDLVSLASESTVPSDEEDDDLGVYSRAPRSPFRSPSSTRLATRRTPPPRPNKAQQSRSGQTSPSPLSSPRNRGSPLSSPRSTLASSPPSPFRNKREGTSNPRAIVSAASVQM